MTQLELVRNELHEVRTHLDQACDALNRMDSYAGGTMPAITALKAKLDKVERMAVGLYNGYAETQLKREIVEHVYKDNLIIEYPDGQFMGTRFADDSGDVVNKFFDSLTDAKAWIDKYVKEC